MVSRLPFNSLANIIDGKVSEPRRFVLKFYNNKCHYCRALHNTYVEISEDPSNEDFYFYAFNTWDAPPNYFGAKLNFEGVPTICIIDAVPERDARYKVIADPSKPNKTTYYSKHHIQKFIKNYRISNE
tara:strand:- start:1625 stop:2008 length:384 start_codon:yes stop_codon:yes gene_type:complete